MPTIDPNRAYSYSEYFELRIDPIDLCEYSGYSFSLEELSLGETSEVNPNIALLKRRITNISTRLILRGEQAKREMLVAPVIEVVVEAANALIRIEYSVNVSQQLKGTVDYLLSVNNLLQLLVVEAKRDDIDYGFTQLMAEMIALDRWERSPSVEQQPVLIGAVTTGSVWQFAQLDRRTKQVVQGVNAFRSPEDLESVVRVLVHALRPDHST